MTTYSVWSENDFIFSISSCFNREGGGGTEVVPLVPASLDQSGQCYLWFSTFFSSRRRGFPKIGFTGRPSGQGQYRVSRGSIGWTGAISTVPLPHYGPE